MNEMYLMVNGRRVEIPTKLVKDINNALECIEVDEFKHLFKSSNKFYTSMMDKSEFNPTIEFVKNDSGHDMRIMYIRLPHANDEWCYLIFKAVEQYCKTHSGIWPDFSVNVARAGYISIRLS